MARPARSRGPYRDPRLVERQGDVLGPSSLLLAVVMVCAVVAMGAIVVGVGRLVPTPVPTQVRTAQPSHVAFVTPVPTGGPSPSSSPRPPAVARDVLRVAFGDPAPVVERGQQVGSVTVRSAVYRSSTEGLEASSGRRWFRVALTYRATAELTYESGRWSALGANGRRYLWARARAPDPALGTGTLEAGKRRTGYLVFSVPATVTIVALVLRDADARDIAVLAVR